MRSSTKAVKGHRTRLKVGEKSEVQFGLEDYSGMVTEIIKACFTLVQDEEGKRHAHCQNNCTRKSIDSKKSLTKEPRTIGSE